MSEILGRVIICRAVKDGLTPGARIGYACSVCQEPLQLTLGGLGILAEYPDSPLLGERIANFKGWTLDKMKK